MRERQNMVGKCVPRITRAAAVLASVVVSATVLAAPQASAATGQLNGFVVAANYSTGAFDGSLNLVGQNFNIGPSSLTTDTYESVMQDRTNVGLTRTGPGAFRLAFHGANNDLWVSGPNYPTDHTITDENVAANAPKMMPGSSPSLVTYPDGNWEVAYQGADGKLWVTGSLFGGTNGGGNMVAANTSPSIAVIPGASDAFQVAWQGGNNDLWVAGRGQPGTDTRNAMNPGTSPSLTALTNGGYEIAYRGSNFQLWLYGTAQTGDTGKPAVGSPSIAAEPVSSFAPAGSFVVAYDTPSTVPSNPPILGYPDLLAVYGNYGGTDMAFTYTSHVLVGSPSIVGVLLPDGNSGFDIAFDQVPGCGLNCGQLPSLYNLVDSQAGTFDFHLDDVGFDSGSPQPGLVTY